jgi:hypothetical protein
MTDDRFEVFEFYTTRNYAKKCIKIITSVTAYQTVKLNGNKPISCVAVITFTAELSLKIALKVVYTISIFVNSIRKSSRRLNSDYCQTRQHKTDHLTPDSARHERKSHQSLVCTSCYQSDQWQNLAYFQFLFRIALTAHSYRKACWTLVIKLVIQQLNFNMRKGNPCTRDLFITTL